MSLPLNNDPRALSAPPCVVPENAKSSFGAFYQATVSPLRRYLASLLGGSQHDAQDLAHDAYVKTFAAMSQDKARTPEALLFTAGRNLAFTYTRSRKNRVTPTDPVTLAERQVGTSPAASEVVAADELSEILRAALAELPPGCREVLNLRYYSGLTVPAIAAKLNITVSGAEKHLIRGLKFLRAEMKRRTEEKIPE